MLGRYSTTAEQAGRSEKIETKFAHDGFRERERDVFKSSSPVVRQGGAREVGHQQSLRTEPYSVRYHVVSCPRCEVNLKTSRADMREGLSLHPQSGSEHELIDPGMSVC